MKHLTSLIFVIVLTVFGLAVCGIDLYHNHVLHFSNSIIGGGALLVALALALPLQMKEAIATLTPFLDRLRLPSK